MTAPIRPRGRGVAADRLDHQLSIVPLLNTVTVCGRRHAETPALAVQINRRLLELVGEFNLQKRRSRAAAEREFTVARLRESQQEPETAEAAQRHF